MASIPCPNCRQPLPANARFCANCGAQLQPAAPAGPPQAAPAFGPPPVGQPGPGAAFGPPPGGPPQAGPAFGPPASVSAPAQQTPGSFPPPLPPQPAPGPQSFGPPPQPGAPPQGPGMPPGPHSFSPPPGAPPGFGQPSQPGMPPAPQGFGPPPQGFGPPFQPGGAMPPAPMPQPKKRRTGLIVGGALLALIVLAAAVVGGIVFLKKGGSNTGSKGGSGTPTVSASPTSGQGGFLTFSSSTFSIQYPQGWQKQETPGAQQDDVQFLSIPSKTFAVDVLNQTRQPKAEDDTRCKGFTGKTTPVSTITLGKQHWTREDCGSGSKVPGITIHAVVESLIYKNKLYVMTYTSTPADTFTADQTKYYLPMEQSFTFLT